MRVTGRVPAPAARGRVRIGLWAVGEDEAGAAAALQRRVSPEIPEHPLPPGTYTVLLLDGGFSMCDAPFVLRNYVPFLEEAQGDVLLTGLGLGCLVHGLLARPAVRSITVLECDADVLSLVGPTVADPRVRLLRADAFSWTPPPGVAFDAAMLDLDDEPRTVARLVDHHAGHARALWPDPDLMSDEPPTEDAAFLLARARAAAL
jgi:hypothetical protein